MRKRIRTAFALVDWHNLQGYLTFRFADNPRKYLPDAILSLQRQIATILNTQGAGDRYRVTLRIYHGWHRERDVTPIRRDFDLFSGDSQFARRFGNVSFQAGFQFGNELLCTEGSHPIYATYRGNGPTMGQKMVDTSIVCDLLHLVRSGYSDTTVIVADDDDFIPALLTAKAWSGQVMLLRRPGSSVSRVTDINCDREVCYWIQD